MYVVLAGNVIWLWDHREQLEGDVQDASAVLHGQTISSNSTNSTNSTNSSKLSHREGKDLYNYGISLMMAVLAVALPFCVLMGLHGLCCVLDQADPDDKKEHKHHFRLLRFAQHKVMLEWTKDEGGAVKKNADEKSTGMCNCWCPTWQTARAILNNWYLSLLLGIVGAGNVGVALYHMETGQPAGLNPRKAYSDCYDSVVCTFEHFATDRNYTDCGMDRTTKGESNQAEYVRLKFIYFFSLTANIAFICKIGVLGMMVMHRTCMEAIETICARFDEMTEEIPDEKGKEGQEGKNRYLDEHELVSVDHKIAFAARVKEINNLKYEMVKYWGGPVGRSWGLGLLCMASVIAAGVNGLFIHLRQISRPAIPERDKVEILPPLGLFLFGGLLSGLAFYCLSTITSKCADREVRAVSIVGALEKYRMTWYEKHHNVSPSWGAQLMCFETRMLSQQMGVNLMGLQYVNDEWFSSMVMAGCVYAPGAYLALVQFLNRWSSS